jgi:predicted acyl esterase
MVEPLWVRPDRSIRPGPRPARRAAATSAGDTGSSGKLVDVYRASAWYPQGYALNLTLTLYPTSDLFMPGHRIRLDVSSSNFARFDVHPNTGEAVGWERRRVVADNTVSHEQGGGRGWCCRLFPARASSRVPAPRHCETARQERETQTPRQRGIVETIS